MRSWETMTSDSNQSSGRKEIMAFMQEAFRLNRNAENPTQWDLFKFVLFGRFVALPDFLEALHAVAESLTGVDVGKAAQHDRA